MSRRIQVILDAEYYDRMKYPKVGEPLVSDALVTKKKKFTRYQPHIIDSELAGTKMGRFINLSCLTELESWQYSIQEVGRIKKEIREKENI